MGSELGAVDQDGPMDEQTGLVVPKTAVARHAGEVAASTRVIRFNGRPMVLRADPFEHYVPLRKEQFDLLAYPILGGVSRSQLNDIYAFLCSTAEDLSDRSHLIGFGQALSETNIQADTDIELLYRNPRSVWDMRELRWNTDYDTEDCVWRSPYVTVPLKQPGVERLKFIMDLAGGDVGLYDDIMQSMAPLVMERKPDGVIWWVGSGANGKSTLMDAIYRVFPGQLASITVKRLVDGRDTPSLNGTLGNIVKESSEGRVEDTEVYKALGTHENFRVHRFHSQDDIEIAGNLHTVFSANSIPSFNDKGYSARRRTFIIPFTQQFKSDPEFERKTFTPEFFGQLISEMCRYAQQIAKQGYRYKWSAATLAAKADYDAEASNAEEYAKHIIVEGVVAFTSYQPLKMDYENWCAEQGYPPLGIANLRKALTACGFERSSRRDASGKPENLYRLVTASAGDLTQLSYGRPGLFTMAGFQPPKPAAEEKPEAPKQTSILNNRW